MTIRKYGFRTTPLMDYDDLFQIGCIGLWKATQLYDDTKKCKFTTYAVFWIRGELERARAYNMRQKRQLRTKSIEEKLPDGDSYLGDLLADFSNPEDEVVAADLKEWLLRKDPVLIALRLQGLSQKQIGKKVGLSRQRISVKLQRLKEVALCNDAR